MEYYKQCGKQV